MSPWQRRLRLIFAIGAVALAIAVAVAFQRRVEFRRDAASGSDPKALVETINFDRTRQNRDKEEVRIRAAIMRAYGDGTAKGEKLTVTTVRSGNRTFVLTSDRAEVGKNESSYVLEGNVQLTSSDGLTVQTDRASYLEAEGVIRAAGKVTFSRGRMSGSGIGFSYDKNQDRLRILKDARVQSIGGTNAEGAQAPMTLTSSTLNLDRVADIMRFENPFTITRGAELIEAANGTGHLTAEEDGLRLLELRGGSSITAAPGGPGSLQKMTGRDMDLTYGADGETLEYLRIVGSGVILVAGEAHQPARRIAAEAFDLPLGARGTTPTALDAAGRVELDLPAEKGTAARTITADTLNAKGDDAKGLTSALFSGKVVFRERSADIDRSATSEALQLSMKPGFSAIDDATFLRPVEFVDGPGPGGGKGRMTARAARGRYALAAGTLDLSGTEPGVARPNVRDDRLNIDANAIDIVLEGPRVNAKGAVRTLVQPSKDDADAKTASMFKKDQPVNVTADELKYDGAAEQAHYSGNAQLWQAETTIKGLQITLDSKTGDLKASGEPVATTAVLMQTTKDGRKERTIANAKSKELVYEEAVRRATYLGDAYLNGPQGELRSPKIELYLKPSGDEVERVEAYEAIALTEPKRKTTGERLTYTSGDEKYVIDGKPVKIVDECSGTTEGRSLTYLKGADRIVVDGSEQMRTRTQGGAKCP
jgi:LPS export ABC transporter protein LptC/lipopolysaccharide transport protein LptA